MGSDYTFHVEHDFIPLVVIDSEGWIGLREIL